MASNTKACSSIITYFERNRLGWPGYSVEHLEEMYNEICAHSEYKNNTAVVDEHFNKTLCRVTNITSGAISYKKDKGRYFYYMCMPNPTESDGPSHNLQLLTYQIAAAWKMYAEAKERYVEKNVKPEHWQWEKGQDVHHRCNNGCIGCHNIVHLKVVPKAVNMSHRINCCAYMMCPVCCVKIKVCHEEDPALRCMNINYRICSNCVPEDYPQLDRPNGTNVSTQHTPKKSLSPPLKRSGRKYGKKRKPLQLYL